MAEILRADVTYWQSAILFCGFDFFALWLAINVPSTEFQVNYDLMTFGDMLHDSSAFCKLISRFNGTCYKLLSFTFRYNDLAIKVNFYKTNTCVTSSTGSPHISANIRNICKCYIRQMYRK